MNPRPVSYLQTDPRWGALDYSARGEKTNIAVSGCGPTALAMVLATWADPKITPKTECAWALAHGYKAPHQGTYYGYFAAAAKRFGLTCKMLNGVTLYGKPDSPYHTQAKAAVDRGDLVIACMGRGLWTSSGHFVLVWKIQGNVIYINDPASTRDVRTQGDYALFKSQVKYYFVVERPAKPKPTKPEQEERMDTDKLIESMTDEQAYTLLEKAMRHAETHRVVTAAVDNLQFKRAVYEGDILVLRGYVTYVGKTSMEVEIDTYTELPDGMRQTVNRAFFVMVAVDEDQKPVQVPDLVISTEAEKARNEAAKMRRTMRKQRRENGF